jgi:hypothetical protein
MCLPQTTVSRVEVLAAVEHIAEEVVVPTGGDKRLLCPRDRRLDPVMANRPAWERDAVEYGRCLGRREWNLGATALAPSTDPKQVKTTIPHQSSGN